MYSRIAESQSIIDIVKVAGVMLFPSLVASIMTTLIFALNRAVAHRPFSLAKTLLCFLSNLFLATMVFCITAECGLSPLGANGLSCLALFMGHDWIKDTIDDKVKEIHLSALFGRRRRPLDEEEAQNEHDGEKRED